MSNKLTRRTFLLMTGGSGAGLMLKSGEKFIHKLIPYINPPQYPKSGEWAFYSTACRECPAGCGMIMWHRDGRVTKAEGNPLHPINKGKLCIRGQSSVQGEYDPDRLKTVLEKDKSGKYKKSNWTDAIASIKNDLKLNKKAIVISDLQTGSLAGVMEQFSAGYNSEPIYYEPLNYESLRIANKETYDTGLIPRYNFKDCDLIISFGAGFLDTWLSPVEYAGDFSRFHSFRNNTIGKMIYLGPAETLTAVNADQFFTITPGDEDTVIFGIIHYLADKGFLNKYQIAGYSFPETNKSISIKNQIEIIGSQIINAKSAIVLAGNPVETFTEASKGLKAANLLNELLGSRSKMDFSQYHALSKTALKQDFINSLKVITGDHIVFIHNANPVYSLNGAAEYLRKAHKIVFIGNMPNETSQLADWILPCHYPLEDWGDYEPWKVQSLSCNR